VDCLQSLQVASSASCLLIRKPFRQTFEIVEPDLEFAFRDIPKFERNVLGNGLTEIRFNLSAAYCKDCGTSVVTRYRRENGCRKPPCRACAPHFFILSPVLSAKQYGPRAAIPTQACRSIRNK
jgi:hypothetical protein